jgi:COMPASS component SPP1
MEGLVPAESGAHIADDSHNASKVADGLATRNANAPSTTTPSTNTTQLSPQHHAIGNDGFHTFSPADGPPLNATATATAAVQQIADNREPSYTRQEPTTSQIRQAPENSAITSLKHEHSSRTQSPLRESSVPVPVPSTETPAALARPTAPPKRSHHKKKGVAAAAVTKRSAGVAKRSHKKKVVSTSATPAARSSPAPRSVRTTSSPAPSSPDANGHAGRTLSGDEEEEEGEPGSDDELYCLCRRPDTGTFMIGCDGNCDDWFHGKCVGVSPDNKGLIDKFFCPPCSEKGLGETTWKRMCRRTSCRLPAMVQQNSKYCSEKCGLLYFKELLATEARVVDAATQDLGAKGGLLSQGELKALLVAAPTIDQFKRLGDGLASPTSSSTVEAEAENIINGASAEEAFPEITALNDIERERLDQIAHLKTTTRTRHALLKDRAHLITMLKQSAQQLADNRGVKPKDLCGYDSRLTWTEDEIEAWRTSPAGQEALRTNHLRASASEDIDGDATMTGVSPATDRYETCLKRKCAKHHEWAKLALDDTRFETIKNADAMRALEKEEKEIKERARMRAREIRAGGVGGTVIFHSREDDDDMEGGEQSLVPQEQQQQSAVQQEQSTSHQQPSPPEQQQSRPEQQQSPAEQQQPPPRQELAYLREGRRITELILQRANGKKLTVKQFWKLREEEEAKKSPAQRQQEAEVNRRESLIIEAEQKRRRAEERARKRLLKSATPEEAERLRREWYRPIFHMPPQAQEQVQENEKAEEKQQDGGNEHEDDDDDDEIDMVEVIAATL